MKTTKRYQIRADSFGLALYEVDDPREALLSFFADRARGEIRRAIRVLDDGTATITTGDGRTYTAVPLDDKETT